MQFCVRARVYNYASQQESHLDKTVTANNAEEAIEVFHAQFDQEQREFLDRNIVEVLTVHSLP